MTYTGLTAVTQPQTPHLGGNISEGDPFTHAPRVWDYLIRRFALRSVLDLGSGLGHSADYFHQAGLRVLAVDGLPDNCLQARHPTLQVDLTQARVTTRVDLVHCQEVVEHIEEQHLDHLLSSLTCGRIIVMTHALPGQGGHHHVNEQPTDYWIHHMSRYHCQLLHEDTHRVRQLAGQEGATYLAQSGLVFSNKMY